MGVALLRSLYAESLSGWSYRVLGNDNREAQIAGDNLFYFSFSRTVR